MGALDDHNRQHTYGNTFGPPTTAAGVSAQQAVDNQNRLINENAHSKASSSVAEPAAKSLFTFALVSGIIAVILLVAAYVVGGIGAAALGLLAVAAGFFTVLFLIMALIQAAKRRL